MPLLSAFDDFFQRSVEALPTLWDRLEFVGDLLNGAGVYHHYGMEERFGTQAAREAMSAVHSVLFEELAATPLQDLLRMAEGPGGSKPVELKKKFRSVASDSQNTLKRGAVPAEHIQFVTSTLTRIAQARDRSNRAAA